MEKKFKTMYKSFRYEQTDDFAAYLTQMAARGWHFVEWGMGLKFEKGEPEDTRYAVEVFINGTDYDLRPEPNTQEFAEYCEAAGWKLVDAKQRFCIFKRIDPKAVPILTDRERLDNTTKAVQGDMWWDVVRGVLFTVMLGSDFINTRFVHMIFSGVKMLLLLMWAALLLHAVWRCGSFYLWRYRSLKKLDNGEQIYVGKGAGRAVISNWTSNYGFFLIAVISCTFLFLGEYLLFTINALVFFVFFGMAVYLNKKRPDSTTNQVIQICVSGILILFVITFPLAFLFNDSKADITGEDVPLVSQDFGVDFGEISDIHLDEMESIMGSAWQYHIGYGSNQMIYATYRSSQEWVLDRIWKDFLSYPIYQDRTDCTVQWDALEAYRIDACRYLVRCDGVIFSFELTNGTELDQSQLAVIRSTLAEGN